MLSGFYKIFNYGSIIVIFAFIILMLFNLVAKDWYIPLLIISIVLLVLRIVFRLYISSYNKKIKEGG